MSHTNRIAATLLPLALAAPVSAHAVDPLELTMFPTGSDYIYVVDGGSCPATITATSTNSLIRVFALDMATGNQIPGNGVTASVLNRVDQVFRVEALATLGVTLTGTIEICWVGINAPDPPCDENNCNPYAPTVVNVTVNPRSISAGNRLSSGVALDPINTSNRELFFTERPDIALGGRFPLGFQRYYAGHLELDGVGPGPLGPNWRHGFEWALEIAGNAVQITSPMGRTIRFEADFFNPGTWTLLGGEDQPHALRESGGDYILAETLAGRMYTFDATGKLTSAQDQNGNSHTFTYSAGQLDQVVDGTGRTLNFAYGGSGEMTSVTDGMRSVGFTYTGAGSLETVTDTESNVTTYAYDAVGPTWLQSRTAPEGNIHQVQTYAAGGEVDTQTAAGGHTTTLARNSGTTTITDPLSGSQVHTHTAQGALTTQQDEDGASATISYDAQGRRTGITDRKGNTTSWTWHAGGKIASMTEADGRSTTLGYTARASNGFTFQDMTSRTLPDASSETFTYDASGNMLTRVDPRGNTWTWTYDAAGNILTSTNPPGGVTTFTWNADGTLDTTTDADSNLTTFSYDALRRVTGVSQADGSTLAYTYDSQDRLLTVTNELSRVSTFVYDRNGNLTSIVEPSTDTWTFAYDDLDRLETVVDPLGQSIAGTYDALGRPATVTDANGKTTTYGYDATGNLVSIADHGSNTWTRQHDAEGLMTSVTDPLTRVESYLTDTMGRFTRVTTGLGHQTNFTYDAMGRLTEIRAPLQGLTRFTYDALGLINSVQLPGGATSSFTRNSLGLTTAVMDPRGNSWTSTYDNLGRRTSRTDPLANQATYQYDQLGRPDHVDLPGGLGSVDVTFDSASHVTRRAYSDATQIDLGYDTNGRVTGGTGLALTHDSAGRLSSSNGIGITRDNAGLLMMLTFSPGKTVSYTYDDANRLAMVSDWAGGITTFAYDAAGQLLSIMRGNTVQTSYEYDGDGRLWRITDGIPAGATHADQTLTRDADGRIRTATRTLPVEGVPAIADQSYTFDAAGQIVGFTYDALGQLVDDGVRTCVWNLASELTSYTESGAMVSFTYDAFGNVLSRTTMAGTQDHVWNYGLGLPSISIVRESAVDQQYYVHSPGGELLYSIDPVSTARSYYHFDEAGNTTLLTDDAGSVTDAWHRTPSGVELARMGTSTTPYTFGGQVGVVQEGSSGLHRMRSRVYDAVTGRFISRDPVEAGDPRGVNPYQYAYNDPLRFVDPFGTTPRPVGDGMMVSVESKFLQISDNFLEDIGVDFRGLESLGGLRPGFAGILGQDGSGGISSPLNTFELDLTLRALGKSSDTNLISTPRIMTVNNQRSRLAVVQDVSFDAVQIAGESASIATISDGVVLDVRPVVSADRRFITMELQPTIAELRTGDFSALPTNYANIIAKLREHYIPRVRYFPPFSVLGISIRTVETEVSMEGGTVLLGGLQREVDGSRAGVPNLSKIPLLGELFRRKGGASNDRSLSVIIRARITDTSREE